jgi:ribonuclease D
VGLEAPAGPSAPRRSLSLSELADIARRSGRLALDTEFMGEGRYRTLLCLIQVAVSDEKDGLCVELIDPLAEGIDLTALAEVLADPGIEVVVHAGRQDIALIRRCLATEVRCVFDTQVAAGFAGSGAQSSYDSLLGEMLGLRLAKSASFTRWDRRPLSDEQLAYAREDVVHLLELATEIKGRLQVSGRLEWARQECRAIEQSSDEREIPMIFARLPRIRSLNSSSQGVAQELVEWREQTAARQDRPVQGVLGDATLVEIAKRKPSSHTELERIRGIGANARGRTADDLLKAVRRGLDRPAAPQPEASRPPAPEPNDAQLVALAEALLRARAREAGLAYELLAVRADLQTIVVNRRLGIEQEADVRTLRGWRRELVGKELLDLLDGRISLSVSEHNLIVEEHPHSS